MGKVKELLMDTAEMLSSLLNDEGMTTDHAIGRI